MVQAETCRGHGATHLELSYMNRRSVAVVWGATESGHPGKVGTTKLPRPMCGGAALRERKSR